MKRKWLPHFAELIDRLSIHQLKEVKSPENKKKYAKEIKDIINDIDILIEEKNVAISGKLIRAIVALSQINTHIWYNESKARKGEDQNLNLLKLTHGLNGLRNNLQNHILDMIDDGDRRDWKTDCLAAEFKEWEISIDNQENNHE